MLQNFPLPFWEQPKQKEAEVGILLKKQEGAMPVTGTAPSLSYLLALIG